MADTLSYLRLFEGELEIGDDFYESFEAPKYVDFTKPDSCHPGEDRHWFCSRVGNFSSDLISNLLPLLYYQ